MTKNIRIRQLLKIYHKAQGVKHIEGFDFPFRPGKPWVMVAYFANGREISCDTYDYYYNAADRLRETLLIP